MGNNNQTRYIDADVLIHLLYNTMPNIAPTYSGDALGQAMDNKINTQVYQAFQSFISNLQAQIERSAVTYDKCMLCVQRDSCIPEHPLGDNR